MFTVVTDNLLYLRQWLNIARHLRRQNKTSFELHAASPLRGYASCAFLWYRKLPFVFKIKRVTEINFINIILMDYWGVDQLGSGSRARITYVAHVTLAIRAETRVATRSNFTRHAACAWRLKVTKGAMETCAREVAKRRSGTLMPPVIKFCQTGFARLACVFCDTQAVYYP